MTAKCLAIVWAPNLVPPPEAPAASMPPGEARMATLKVRAVLCRAVP